jgi:hypothetical protein
MAMCSPLQTVVSEQRNYITMGRGTVTSLCLCTLNYASLTHTDTTLSPSLHNLGREHTHILMKHLQTLETGSVA